MQPLNDMLPQLLSLKGYDALVLKDKAFEDDASGADIYAKEHSGVVFTQITGDTGKIYYEKALHIVNRTGIHVVVLRVK